MFLKRKRVSYSVAFLRSTIWWFAYCKERMGQVLATR